MVSLNFAAAKKSSSFAAFSIAFLATCLDHYPMTTGMAASIRHKVHQTSGKARRSKVLRFSSDLELFTTTGSPRFPRTDAETSDVKKDKL